MDDIPSWVLILLLFLFLAMSAFYSAAETSFSTLNKYKYRALAGEGNRKAKLIVWASDHFESLLITVLIGYNVFSILISTFSAFLAMRWLSPYINDTLLSLLTSIVMAIITFMFGDTIPKFLGKKRSETVANLVIYPITFFIFLFSPISILFKLLSKAVVNILGGKKQVELSEEEFADAIDTAEEQGLLEENESDIIQATFDFADMTVKEVLTSRNKMAMLDASTLKKDKLNDYLLDCPFSRIPIYYKNPNKVIGVLIVKNYLNAYLVDPRVSYLSYLQKPYFVSPSVKIDDLLDGFRKRHTQIALVRKEDKLLGMVTSEDVLEELVGKINENPSRKEAKS